MQVLEPVLALVVVGYLLVSDLERSPAHAIVAVVGGLVGYAFGAYRARSTYVSAVRPTKACSCATAWSRSPHSAY